MSTPTDVTRRSFVRAAAAGGAAALALPAVNALGASETLNVGLIGTGGRCRALMKSLARIPRVRMAAVCDVYDRHLDLARKLADPKALATPRPPPTSPTRRTAAARWRSGRREGKNA
jgi:hypothetical protein